MPTGNPYHDKAGSFTQKEKDAGKLDVSSWKEVHDVKVGSHSNPGGVFKDSHGTLHYVKLPQRNPEQAQTEHLADAIYRELGIPAKDSEVVMQNGEMGLSSKMLPGSVEIGKAAVNKSADVKSGYVADAYLASWDVFGMTYDNIMASNGRDYRVDNGGTMFFRAQGETKKFPADRVDELDTLIAPGKKGNLAFAGLTDAQKTEQARHLVTKLPDEKLVQLIANAGLTGARAQEYLTSLKGRRDVIAKRFGVQKIDFASILRKKKKKQKNPPGFQDVPMDIDKINAAMEAANS
jgi:hypothetical protein